MATDLPNSVPELQGRLKTAREKYAELSAANRKLIRELGSEREARIQTEEVWALMADVIRGKGADPGAHPLLREAVELVYEAHLSISNRMRADHRLALVRQTIAVLGLLPRPLPELMEGIGGKQEAVRLLAMLRAELADEDPR